MSKSLVIKQLDESLIEKKRTPKSGWIKMVRKAIGMKAKDLALRLNVDPSTISKLEKNESDGKITINTLKKLAQSMNCELVYGLRPRGGSFSSLIQAQAISYVSKNIDSIQHSMVLEKQGLTSEELQILIETQAKRLSENVDSDIWTS